MAETKATEKQAKSEEITTFGMGTMAEGGETNPIPVFRYQIVDFLDVSETSTPQYEPMQFFESIDESTSAQVVDKHYVDQKANTKITTGYQTQFPITGDVYKNSTVSNKLQKVAEEQKLGEEYNFVRVNLFEPIEDEEKTYYARKFKVSPEIANISGSGGEIVTFDGNLNAMGDVIIGKFKIDTKVFTPNE